MIKTLSDAGYLVVKVPPCDIERGHGRHSLVTRSAMCPGKEPIPHAFLNGYMSSFGFNAVCACGRHLSTVPTGEDATGPSEWDEHKTEHDIDDRPRHLRGAS